MPTNYTIRQGNTGIGVNKIQGYLNIFQNRGFIANRVTQDGIFGSGTKTAVTQFQRYANLSADGIVGERTWDAMIGTLRSLGISPSIPVASQSFYLTMGNTGLDVYKMQQYLNAISVSDRCLRAISADGTFGSETRQAVTQFQYLNNLTADGIIGANTWDTIIRRYFQI